MKQSGFNVAELVTDKDSSVNGIYCRHFPEGTITYCSNHSAKTLHKDLQGVKQNKCECRKLGLSRCKRMNEAFITSCKTALRNLISSEAVLESEDPHASFSDGLMNFYFHYCYNDHTSTWCYHEKEKDGKPYTTKHYFSCKAQADAFRELLVQMANRPQDYITPRGRTTTNSVEGFHGLSLMYRDKRTDLGHRHYICKTNMATCHKNIGPVWKVICCLRMGVPMPVRRAARMGGQTELVSSCGTQWVPIRLPNLVVRDYTPP